MSLPTSIVPQIQGSSIAISGAEFTRTGIKFQSPPSRETLNNVGRALGLMESCIDWGWADFLPQMVAHHARGKKPDRNQEQLTITLVSEYAATNGRNAPRLHEREKIGRMFPPSMRRDALTYDHHAEAFILCNGDVEKANGWLSLAEKNQWTVAQLRASIRRSVSQPSQGGDYLKSEVEISNLELSASRRLRVVREFTAERARAELESLRNTVALVDALRARCA